MSPYDSETLELMYAVMPSARKQGYATEIATALVHYALSELSYRRVIALILPSNEYSKRVAVRVGFKDGGLIRNIKFAEKVHQFILEQDSSDNSIEVD